MMMMEPVLNDIDDIVDGQMVLMIKPVSGIYDGTRLQCFIKLLPVSNVLLLFQRVC